MSNSYKQLNQKLQKQINAIKNAINYKLNLLESGSGVEVDGSGLDPAYNGQIAASLQNKGYISGIQGGDSDAVIANPSKIIKTAAELAGVKLGAFGFDKTPQKPLLSNNIGLGMGFGIGDQEFQATKQFVNQYSKNFKLEPYQQLDQQELGYISWKSVNDAVSNKGMQDLTKSLETWGLYSPTDNGMLPTALPDSYSVMDPNKAFAKKFKQIEDVISGKPKNEKSKTEKANTKKINSKNRGKTVTKSLKSLKK